MEGYAFLAFCLGIGYVLYWVIQNERSKDPDHVHTGWIGMKRPDGDPVKPPPARPQSTPRSRPPQRGDGSRPPTRSELR